MYIYITYICMIIARSNIINLSVYEFINFRYMNVTLNRDEESRFKKTLDPEVADVVKNKRLLLFRSLLDEIAFEDPVAFDHMEKGVKLVGWEDDSPLYSKRCPAPTITETQLNSDAVWRRKALRGRSSALGEAELADQLWDETAV